MGGQGFTNASFTITSTADTAQITNPFPGIISVPNLTATVTVSGLGTGTFTNETTTVDNQVFMRVGISDLGLGLAILFIDNAAFGSYDLTSSIGPLTGPTAINSGQLFPTTAGNFSLTSVPSATFQATLQGLPEPASFTLLGIGIAGMAGYAWRRRKQQAKIGVQIGLILPRNLAA
jgi:hypothetical protein